MSTQGHPVVDIGAGTGLTTQAIARVLPAAEILAIEPDPAMRIALMSRIWSDADLRSRVSILPMSILDAPLPPVISAAVAGASLVHFAPQQRLDLWALLASRLAPWGRAILEIQCPSAQDVPDVPIATAQVGRMTYEGWASAKRIDDQRLCWHLTYVSSLNGVEIDRQSTEYMCWAVSSHQVLHEAKTFGLTGCVVANLVTLQQQQ